MPYTFDEDTFRLAVRALIKNRILKEDTFATLSDKALLPNSSAMPVDDVTGGAEKEDVLDSATDAAVDSIGEPSDAPSRDITAERRLRIRARENALDFEQEIVKQLDLMDPNQLSPEQQQAYVDAMEEMSVKLEKAVMDAVASLKGMPKAASESGK
jgi:hypothetical protein